MLVYNTPHVKNSLLFNFLHFNFFCLNWTSLVIKSRPEEHEKAGTRARSIHLAGKCKDESVLLSAGSWMCRFCDPRVKFQHREKRRALTVWLHVTFLWKELLQYAEEIVSALRPGFRWHRVWSFKEEVADSLSRSKLTSQTVPRQRALFLGIGVSASVHAEVLSLDNWPMATRPHSPAFHSPLLLHL